MLNRVIKTILVTALFGMLISLSVSAQMKTKTMTFNKGEVTIIQGLGAIIKKGEKNLTVEMVMPKDNLPKEYKDVDLKVQDQIIMCNGKRVKTIAELEAVLDGLEVGGAIELGIKRDQDMMIVSFPKADPEAGGQMMMMTTTIGDDDEDGAESSVMNINGKEIHDAVFMAAGLVLHEEDGAIKVASVLPMLKENIKGTLPSEGDLVVSMDGKSYSSAKTVRSAYQDVPEGKTITMVLKSGDSEYTISFVKQKLDDNVIIKK